MRALNCGCLPFTKPCPDPLTTYFAVQAAREACLHPKIRHPNIISLYASWIEDNKIIMCIEHAPTGRYCGSQYYLTCGEAARAVLPLTAYLCYSAFRKLRSKGAFDEMVTARYIIQCLLHALQFMHGFGLVHRDIKPENILLTSDGCCLADFGLSINQKVEKPSLCLGTFDYMVCIKMDCAKLPWNLLSVREPVAVKLYIANLIVGTHPCFVKPRTGCVNLISIGYQASPWPYWM